MSMKNGIVILIGKVVDLVPDNFTGKNGEEVKKLNVLIKPSDESAPIECECWGEWEYQGKTNRRVSVRIMEWENLGSVTEVNSSVEAAISDPPF